MRARGKNWMLEFSNIFGPPSRGRHRAAFIMGNYVFKVPMNSMGVDDNEHETNIRSSHHALCWIEYDADNFPILVMERVDIERAKWIRKPHWVNAVDCQQVGHSKRTGQLIIYDFGYH